MEKVMKLHPTVCVVGKNYQIMIVTEKDALISVRVGDKKYYHHTNGIRICTAGVHRFTVPQEVLDSVGEYTVIAEDMIERLAYFTKTAPPVERTYKFRPLTKTEDINIYHLADVHGEMQQAIDAARYENKNIDLMILNGDISSTSDTFEDIILSYKITSEVAKGEIPCIISRGNHDLRGQGAENLAKCMPSDDGRSYYTFRIGCIWGILVDTGEDKDDSHIAYGGTICCHEFRLEQEEMIKKVIKNAQDEYDAVGVKYRLVLSHIPFTFKREEEFDIERELYMSWSKLLKDNIKPDIMLCGHTHKACISEIGSEYDELGQPCTVVVAADMGAEDNKPLLAGSHITVNEGKADIVFNTGKKVLCEGTVKF